MGATRTTIILLRQASRGTAIGALVFSSFCITAAAAYQGSGGDPLRVPDVDSKTLIGLGDVYMTQRNVCGPIAASVILRQFGIVEPIETLAEQVRLTPAGTSLLHLQELFISRGLEAIPVEIEADKLGNLLRANPDVRAIAFVEPEHWIAVVGMHGNAFRIYSYPRMLSMSGLEFARHFKRAALVIARPGVATSALGGNSFIFAIVRPTVVLWIIIVTALAMVRYVRRFQ